MEIINIKISDLKPAEYNPRQMTEKQALDLEESLKRFGFVDPLVVNSHKGRENVVIGGHQRLKIAQKLGFEEVPVVYVDLKLEREQELNLRLNRNLGEWDWDLLANFDKELLLEVGFDKFELDKILDLKEDEFDAEKEYEKITEPQTKLGDLYQLGNHRLLCGDSTKEEDFKKLMDGQLARMIFTDPPYNVNYTPQGGLDYDPKRHTRGYGEGKIFNDNMSDEECLEFYINVLKNLFNFSANDCCLYWWFANANNWLNRQAWFDSDWKMSQIIIWIKNSMVFSRGQIYHRCYESCMLGWKNKKKHFNNKHIINAVDILALEKEDFIEMADIWFEHRDITANYVHPTQKPVRRAERAIKKSSEVNDIILDCFGGSGSTLMACEQLQRKCFMMELDPKYVSVILDRWEQFTGEKAVKLN